MQLSELMALRRGHGPGFDLLRLAAAALVLVSHAYPITYGDNDAEPLWRLSGGQLTLGRLAVGLFFATSGFLVAASFERARGLGDFAWRRAVRILPALWTTVGVCVVVAAFLTDAAPGAYWRAPGTWTYLLNGLFRFQAGLPGLFERSPVAATVNGSLWTLVHEVSCYLALAVAGALGLLRRRFLVALATALCALHYQVHPPFLGRFWELAGLAAYFGAGASLYLYRDKVPMRGALVLGSLAAFLIACRTGGLHLVAPAAVAYAAVWLGFRAAAVPLGGDYSYGVYLWAFPVQQLVAERVSNGPLLNIAVALPVTLGLALASWRLIEKPALRAKGLFARERRAAQLA